MTERPPVPGLVRTRTPHDLRTALRAALARPEPLVVPGVTDAMSARLTERQGFGAAYVTGAGMSNAQYGLPDVGLVSLAEVVENVGRLTAAVDLPLIVDADTGYGGPVSAMRTLTLLERAGAAAIQFEDQEMPKRCGHFDNHSLVPTGHMQSKLDAALQARQDDALVVVARTDARSAEGSIQAAIDRAGAYLDAGADVLFVEAPRTVEELEMVGRSFPDVPLVVNVVEGGRTPALTAPEYAELGFGIVLYANFLMRAAIRAESDALAYLREHGETAGFADRIVSWQERQELFDLPQTLQAEAFYDVPWEERP
ncbi:isocitrate lyase/PEP mutase family protein [Cellulomonas dongxiuzhuiae]|uniref:Oxaloacetate decarboxylase n=1 Tax=Cellulomonas dongxiuzhuiae TaxID=2819979 RepID=A0ABX8GET1_9CELL|nr:oxaloacetate decarboxylase [Cellulomonas dongxiuzhuiae]MBO3087134.1 oxaloacetate decarboxylase [Cellulomonas dongxiuzhuiae]MBO3093507.1 oxaloacetate decarboxylase [Cellulomonas dongxiuzhuiae]QWC14639.1 oxaloacetate decarboxylase [Cellulomonas dongxiuzhuiae]